jgi:hypothetical protein
MMDDLTMMANAPLSPADVEKAEDADLGKAAAGETMPPPKDECEECEDTRAERIARRGQEPPAPGAGNRPASAREASYGGVTPERLRRGGGEPGTGI